MLVVLCACSKDTDTILYRSAQMGFVQTDGSFKGDDGKTYVFSNISSDTKWEETRRLMALFDVTGNIDGNNYSAKLIDYHVPIYKKPFAGATPELIDSLGTAPLKINDVWYSGGCLNMLNTLIFTNPESKHSVDLLIREFPMTSDTLKLIMMHNAGDDMVDEYAEEMSGNTYTFYTSFPLSEYLSEEKETVISLEWRWKGETNTITSPIKK